MLFFFCAGFIEFDFVPVFLCFGASFEDDVNEEVVGEGNLVAKVEVSGVEADDRIEEEGGVEHDSEERDLEVGGGVVAAADEGVLVDLEKARRKEGELRGGWGGI